MTQRPPWLRWVPAQAPFPECAEGCRSHARHAVSGSRWFAMPPGDSLRKSAGRVNPDPARPTDHSDLPDRAGRLRAVAAAAVFALLCGLLSAHASPGGSLGLVAGLAVLWAVNWFTAVRRRPKAGP